MEHLLRQRDWKGLGKTMNGAFLCVEIELSDCKILNIQTSCPIIDDPDYMDIKIQVDMYDDTLRNFFATIPNCSYKELCDFFIPDKIKYFNNVCDFLLMFIRKFSGRSCGRLHFSTDKFEGFPETVSLNIPIGNGDVISKIDFKYENCDRKMIESFTVYTTTNKTVCVEMDLSKYEWADEPINFFRFLEVVDDCTGENRQNSFEDMSKQLEQTSVFSSKSVTVSL